MSKRKRCVRLESRFLQLIIVKGDDAMPTIEEMRKYTEKYKKEREEFNKHLEESRLKDLETKSIKPFDESQVPKKYCDHPNTMENGTATFFYIIVMIEMMPEVTNCS